MTETQSGYGPHFILYVHQLVRQTICSDVFFHIIYIIIFPLLSKLLSYHILRLPLNTVRACLLEHFTLIKTKQCCLVGLEFPRQSHLRLLWAINMLVSRARASVLCTLVKTHNYLIYILFPPKNRKPLCAPTLHFPPSAMTIIRVIVQSSSCGGNAPMSPAGWGEAGQQQAESNSQRVWDVQTGSGCKGYFLGNKTYNRAEPL